jgi:hypothetical protein
MYEATCPSCGHVTKASFIRIGAVVVCDACRQRWQVEHKHVARKVQASESALSELIETSGAAGGSGASGASGAAAPTKPGTSESRPGEWKPPTDRPTPAPGSAPTPGSAPAPGSAPVTGQAAGSGTGKSTQTAAPAPAAAPSRPSPRRTAPAAVATPPAPQPRARKRAPVSWSRLYALGASILVTGILIIALIVAAMDGGTGRGGSTASPGAPGGLPALDPSIPMLTAEAFAWAGWQTVDEPATVLTPPIGPVMLNQEAWVRPAGARDYVIYTAQAAAEGADVVARATLQLTMIDDEGRVFARCALPLLHLNNRKAVPVAVPTPQELRRRMAQLVWEVTIEETWPGAVLIDDARIQAYTSGRQTLVRVKAFNPLALPMQDATFVISGSNEQGRPVGTWRVRCGDDLGPKRSIEFTVLIDPDEPPTAWTIHGAGTPITNP